MITADSSVRRCAMLHVEPRERLFFDPIKLLSGEDGIISKVEWVALAPHVGGEVSINEKELHALSQTTSSAWKPLQELTALIGQDSLDALLGKGLLVSRDADDLSAARDKTLRDSDWHAGAAISHTFSRWSDTDADAIRRQAQPNAVAEMVERCGPPPPHFHRREDALSRLTLEVPETSALDALLKKRATCRNFDTTQALSSAQISTLLHRVFGVHGSEELARNAVALKKNHPSGGSLHPLEAYLIVQRVEGLQPGLYHYNVEAHALDLLREMSVEDAYALSLTGVAGQGYFAEAPVMLVIAARFARSFWKYRNHPKIYRAILLETGHASQNLYLAATDMGFGAYITAAINEVEIEQAFNLDPLLEGPLAVCGFGPRAREKLTVELDPGARVWDGAGRLVSSSLPG